MAILYITQYDKLASQEYGPSVQVGLEPSLGDSTVAIGSSSEQSGQLNPKTRFVMVHTDAICHVAFGGNPTATTGNRRLPADATIFYGVDPTKDLQLAVITGT